MLITTRSSYEGNYNLSNRVNHLLLHCRYTLDKRSFTTGHEFEPNSCYNVTLPVSREYADMNGGGLISGAIDASICNDQPLAISEPHFLDASKHYLLKVKGLQPDHRRHRSFLEVSRDFGLTTRALMRYQYNIPLEYGTVFEPYKRAEQAMLPIMWVEHDYQAPPEFAKKVWHWTTFAEAWGWVAFGFFITSGIVLIVIAIWAQFQKKRAEASAVHEVVTFASTSRRPPPRLNHLQESNI